jgi:hypothetical protein
MFLQWEIKNKHPAYLNGCKRRILTFAFKNEWADATLAVGGASRADDLQQVQTVGADRA